MHNSLKIDVGSPQFFFNVENVKIFVDDLISYSICSAFFTTLIIIIGITADF